LAGCAGRPNLDLGDPLDMADATGPARLWGRDLGRAIEVAPVAARGTLLCATTDAKLWRLALKDGAERWKCKLYSSPVASPLVCGSTVVVATDAPRYIVEGVDLETGKVLWKEPFAFPAAPVAFDTVLVVAARGGRIVRMDAATGARRWEARLPGAGWKPPVVRPAEGCVLVPVRPDSLVALDLATGKRVWGRSLGGLPWLAAGGDPLAALTEAGELWLLDPVSGEPISRRNLDGAPAGPPVVFGGSVFVALREGRLLSLRAADLETVWSRVMAPPLVTPPVADGDGVAQAGPLGVVVAIGADGQPGATYHHPELIVAAPLLHGDLLISGGAKGTLIAYRRTP
jgi:outer membrane protein assembly factor BamB